MLKQNLCKNVRVKRKLGVHIFFFVFMQKLLFYLLMWWISFKLPLYIFSELFNKFFQVFLFVFTWRTGFSFSDITKSFLPMSFRTICHSNPCYRIFCEYRFYLIICWRVWFFKIITVENIFCRYQNNLFVNMIT